MFYLCGMKQQIKDIREFQQKIAETAEGTLFTRKDTNEQIELRTKLLQEEVDELQTSLEHKDQIESLDAIIDILYIVLGTAQELGVLDKLEDAWTLVHENNLTKLDADGKVHKNEYGKVIKPKGYKPVDLSVLWTQES